ncbi:MAG: hypothetical protein RJB66_2684 [Pseudomonadota bacterium]
MNNDRLGSTLVLFVGLTLMGGCGTKAPFQRGKVVIEESGQKNEKPNTVPTATPTPLPTGEPKASETPVPTVQPSPEPLPAVTLNRAYFNSEILPLLAAKKINGTTKGCSMCHGNPARTFEDAQTLVVPGQPEKSRLYMKATGAAGSGHMQIWASDSPEAMKLLFWISGKAQ